MKKRLFILLYSIYLFFLLGLILHTSAHPQVFNKYTIKYLVMLIVLSIGFFPFLWFAYFTFQTGVIRIQKKKIIIKPWQKLLIYFLLLTIITTPVEFVLRNKYKNYESENYLYTIDNFDPFLQSKVAKHENLTINSLGFRGEEIPVKKTFGTYRIFVLGGSTVLNREVEFENNLVRLLEKKLRVRYPNRKIEVINAGKDYYTSEHSLIQYMFKISDLNPDLIIMWHGANDMGVSCTIEEIVSHGEYKSDYSHMFGAVANIVFDYFRPQPVIQLKLISLDFLIKAMQDNLYSDLLKNLQNKAREKAARDFKNGINTVTVHRFPSIESYNRNLSYFVDLTEKKGIKLILGNQPTLIKKDNTIAELEKIIFPGLGCKKDNMYYSLESLVYGLNLFNSETKKISEENNIMFLDLDKNLPKNLEYYLDGFHYTKKGNKQISDTLYDFIISRQLIE